MSWGSFLITLEPFIFKILRNKLLSYILKTRLSLKNMLCPLPKLVTIDYLENHINHMFILKLEKSFSILSFHNQQI